jgi:hypothetical protein
MPTLQVHLISEMHYRIDDFTDPWSHPETI